MRNYMPTKNLKMYKCIFDIKFKPKIPLNIHEFNCFDHFRSFYIFQYFNIAKNHFLKTQTLKKEEKKKKFLGINTAFDQIKSSQLMI